MIELIVDACRSARLDVENVDGLLNVSHGTGIMASKTNIDPERFLAWLAETEPGERARFVAGYVHGVKTVLLEPKRSDAASWTFVEAAGSLLPSVEVETFVHGVRDATGGDPAWVDPLAGDLVIGWTMRLNRGLRPVTEAQFDRWGVTSDRVHAAGRSLLFHHSRHVDWEPTGRDGVLVVAAGDGHDAARILIAEDAWFTDVDRNWRYAMPSPDALLAVSKPDDVDALRAETSARFADAEYPLSEAIWHVTASGPQRLKEDDE